MVGIQTLPVDRFAKVGLLTLVVDRFATPGFPNLMVYRLAPMGLLAWVPVHCATVWFPTLAAGCLAVVFLTLVAHHLATVWFQMLVTDHCPSVVQTVEKDPTIRALNLLASPTQVSCS